MATKFQAIQKRLNTNPLNVSQPKTPAPATAPVVSVSPKAINSKQNFGMWSAEWWMVSPTIATYNNPVVRVKTPKTAFDYSTLDKWWLQDEIARLTFRMKNGSITEDDAVNYNRLTRTLAEQNSATANTMDTSEIERLRAEQEAIKGQRMTADEEALASFKQAQAAQLAQRTAAIQQAGAKQREAAQAATSFSWFGRSTVNAEQQASIEQQIQQSILYENAASDLAIQKYQAELQGASSEVLAGYDQQIAAAQWQASQIRQDAVAEANKLNTEQSAMFGDNLQWLIANKTIAAPKVERIGWTNKSPIYGYWDGTKFVTTNAQWVPTVRSGWGGWTWWGGTGWTAENNIWAAWWINNPLDLVDYNVKFKNQDQSNAFTYATRMIEASNIFNQTEDEIAWLSKWEYILQKSYGKLPYWSALQSDTLQKQTQAEQNFINAVLRKESWAAIAPSEYNNAEKQYFPQPWDSADVLEQKRRNRLTALKWISAATGNQKSLTPAINAITQKKTTQVPAPQQPITTPVKTTSTKRASIFN